LIARISTERHEHAPGLSVSQIIESEKWWTARLLHFHFQFQPLAFLHRQSHIRSYHANRKIAAE